MSVLIAEAANRRYALVATTLAAFLTPFTGAAVNVALPRPGGEFSVNAIALGWVATSYVLAAAIGLVPLGRVADVRGQMFSMGIAMLLLALFVGRVQITPAQHAESRVTSHE